MTDPVKKQDHIASIFSASNLPQQTSRYGALETLTQKIDQYWEKAYQPNTTSIDTYFDYFFSGQDIVVHIDGTESNAKFSSLPIINLAYNITQKKQPLFGYLSYTFDFVLRGTRIVQGQFTLATRYPGYMVDVLTQAAITRSSIQATSQYLYYRNQTEDEENIQQYWTDTQDPSVSSQGANLYSMHPPFNLIIMYGVQSNSLNATMNQNGAMLQGFYNNSNATYTDVNERLIVGDGDTIDNDRMLLVDCEIVSCDQGFGSDGNLITETYGFFARDIFIPTPTSSSSQSSKPVLIGKSNPPRPPITQ